MNTQELSTLLTSELKSYIKKKGYVSSGKLYKSIDFNVMEVNKKLDIKLNSQDYILYLEDGNLLQNFFNQKKVLELIAKYEAEIIQRDIIIDIQKRGSLD